MWRYGLSGHGYSTQAIPACLKSPVRDAAGWEHFARLGNVLVIFSKRRRAVLYRTADELSMLLQNNAYTAQERVRWCCIHPSWAYRLNHHSKSIRPTVLDHFSLSIYVENSQSCTASTTSIKRSSEIRSRYWPAMLPSTCPITASTAT